LGFTVFGSPRPLRPEPKEEVAAATAAWA
jgi:hypothetical protein